MIGSLPQAVLILPPAQDQKPRESLEGSGWITAEKQWPVLSEKALYGLAGDFVRLACENSEADPAAVLMTFLTRFGIECGPGPHVEVGDGIHQARLFCVIAGNTAKARKGTSAQPVDKLFGAENLSSCDNGRIWTPALTSPGPLSSGEGLIYPVRDEVSNKRLFVLDPEFGAALQCNKRQGNTLSPLLRCLWDSGTVEPLTKNARIRTSNAHIGVVTHITIEELSALLPKRDIFSGLANRFLWILARRPKLVPLPQPMEEMKLQRISNEVFQLLTKAQKIQDVGFSREAEDLWLGTYNDLSKEVPGLLGAAINRSESQVRRISLIYALLDGASEVRVEHLEAALAVWAYAESSARYIFGEPVHDTTSGRIVKVLKKGNKSLSELYKIFSNNISKEELHAVIQELEESGKIESMQEEIRIGRPKTVYCLKE